MTGAFLCGLIALMCWPLRVQRPPAGARSSLMPRQLVSRLRRRRRVALPSRAAFTTLVQSIAPAVEAGVPPALAVAAAASVTARTTDDAALSADLTGLALSAGRGEPLAPVWSMLAARYPMAALDPVARAWALSDRVGCGLSDALTTAVDSMREQEEHRRRVSAATAGPRATMQLLTLLPIAGVAVCAVIGVNPIRLYSGPAGLGALALGLALLWCGRIVIRRMIARSCRPGALR